MKSILSVVPACTSLGGADRDFGAGTTDRIR
jgi:hypothetical protein